METIFYSDPRTNPINPCGALDARKAIYGTNFRSSSDHAWLTKKMAYANASAKHESSGRGASLALPHGGGISGKGLYEPGQSSAGKWNPKPHISSVKISSEGDFGSIKKCELAFTVYNLGDLNSMQAFFDLGAKLSVRYGWNQAGGAGGAAGSFKGIVYNFSYQVTPVGGFDCVCHGMSEGISILSTHADAAAKSAEKITDALNDTIIGNSLSGVLKVKAAKQEALTHGHITDAIGCLELPASYGAAEGTTETSGTPAKEKKHYYVSLEALVSLLVERLKAASGSILDELSIKCDGTVTKVNPVTDNAKLVSGNYMEVVFPGYGKYGGEHDYGFGGGGYVGPMAQGDASKIMINIEWITKQISDMGAQKNDNQKSADASTSKLLGIIFQSIYKNSGTRFKLSIVQNPKIEKEFWIQDINYIDKRITPYSITAVTNNSIARSISLQARVPDKMATMAFVGTDSSTTGKANLGVLTDKTKAADPTAMEDLEAAKKPMDAKDPNSDKGPTGPTSAHVSALQEALKRVYVEPESGSNNKNEAIPFPIDFSCTLDGVEGFIFGNVVTTNYLPTVYQRVKVAFTVTKVEHNVSANDWTTSLQTVCRLLT
jgi:hypothetical protein